MAGRGEHLRCRVPRPREHELGRSHHSVDDREFIERTRVYRTNNICKKHMDAGPPGGGHRK
eukprot:1173099-Prorocentrum_minimum.AAC.1